MAKKTKRQMLVLRWTARLWSLGVLIFAVLMIFSPDQNATEPIHPEDIFLLSFWGIAILGLIIAWFWEKLGALITIVTMPIREVAYVIVKNEWTINFLLIWVLVIPPAVMFLLSHRLSQKSQ